MNLWVKRAGQLLVVALLLISCEDDSFLLGFKNQNKKFKGAYQEFLLGEWGDGIVFPVDSIITDNLVGSRLLIGKYTDPVLGTVESSAFAEFRSNNTAKLDATSVYDSVTFQMQIDFYSYALTDKHVERFTVHRITEDTLTIWGDSEGNTLKRYYSQSTIGYDPTPLGQASVEVNIDSLKKNLQKTTGFDTILAKTRLDDAFGLELFNVSFNNPDSILSKTKLFRNQFKGLAFVPDAASTAVLGYSPASSLTKIILHYHTMKDGQVGDTLSRVFTFDALLNNPLVSFHNITATRPGGYPSADFPYQGTTPAKSAIQSGSALATKIDIRKFYEFADTIDNMIINSAELIIESVDKVSGLDPISNFELRVTKDDNQFYRKRSDADSLAMLNFHLITESANGFYYPLNDTNGAGARLSYNSTTEKYNGFVTLFFQNLFEQKSADTRIEFLSLFPASNVIGINQTAAGKMVNRTVFNKNAVKLRIYYTTPNTPNL